jgi:hypothetical protein
MGKRSNSRPTHALGLLAKRRRLSATKSCSAALTLLALKQESLSATSCVGEQEGKTEQLNRCESVAFDRRVRNYSMCSSVTDDEEDTAFNHGILGSTTSRRFSSSMPEGSHLLINMALTRPNLCLVGKESPIHAFSRPALMLLPEGRPLPLPPRLPSGIVAAPKAVSLAKMKAT